MEDREALRQRPANLLMWRSLNWARERGAETFDFGTSLANQTGLIRFKEGWGGQDLAPALLGVVARRQGALDPARLPHPGLG